MSAAARHRYASSDGDDKAFWISFADLMTALMVLFLMVMAVALLTITRAQTSGAAPGAALNQAAGVPPVGVGSSKSAAIESAEINQLLKQIAAAVDASPGVNFDARRHVIDFGDRARFQTASHRLDAGSAKLLREFIPQLLVITESALGQRWVRRVVVEGFADPRGDYLYNLNLSLQRAQRVLCTLLEPGDATTSLSAAQQVQVRGIFAVGGFSFNDQRASLDASRRIEMRIEFGPPPVAATTQKSEESGVCRLPG